VLNSQSHVISHEHHIMKVHYFHECTCVVEPIWEMTNTYLYYFAILIRWLVSL